MQTAGLTSLHVTETLSPNTNEPTLRRVSDLPGAARLDHPINRIDPMNTQTNAVTFCIVLASYLTAGLMGVAFVQSAAENSFQHSGTQRYVRVVR